MTHKKQVTSCKWLDHWQKWLENLKMHRLVCEADTPKPNSSDQAIKFLNEIFTCSKCWRRPQAFYLRVFSMGLFFKLHNLLLAAKCHDISKKSSHLKTCNLAPVCHRLYSRGTLQTLVRNFLVCPGRGREWERTLKSAYFRHKCGTGVSGWKPCLGSGRKRQVPGVRLQGPVAKHDLWRLSAADALGWDVTYVRLRSVRMFRWCFSVVVAIDCLIRAHARASCLML